MIITPFREVTRLIYKDLAAHPGFPESVGLMTSQQKDFTGDHDVVLASAYTIGRPDNLARLRSDDYDLVIIDESSFSLAPTWRRILTHLGFLDDAGAPRANPGKMLVGLTADPTALRDIFGDGALIGSPPLQWFEDRGHLHHVRERFVDCSDALEFVELHVDGEKY